MIEKKIGHNFRVLSLICVIIYESLHAVNILAKQIFTLIETAISAIPYLYDAAHQINIFNLSSDKIKGNSLFIYIDKCILLRSTRVADVCIPLL